MKFISFWPEEGTSGSQVMSSRVESWREFKEFLFVCLFSFPALQQSLTTFIWNLNLLYYKEINRRIRQELGIY